MVGALLYLQFHTVKNRILFRLKRLRQPKYLFAAIIGGAYFYFYFFRWAFGMRRGTSPLVTSDNPVFLECAGALVLFTLLLAGWIFPRERAALSFTEAEVAFLFPAPISRRNLIHFKLLRSQSAILFGSVILMLLTQRLGGLAWMRALGWWVVLSFINLHLTGAAFFRTRLLDSGITTWKRRIGIFVLLGLAVAGIILWTRKALPAVDFLRLENFRAFQDAVVQVLNTGPALYLLFPLRLVVRPYLAHDALSFLIALAPALLVLAVHYVWVIRSDVAFEEASVEASRKLAEKVAAMRAGNWRGTTRKFKPKRAPFRLAPEGMPSMAFVWKNLISAGQGFSPRIWVLLAVVTASFGLGLRGVAAQGGAQAMAAAISGMLLIWSLLLGPQLFRHDFRQDLVVMDVLTSYPMRGWQIALGQILAPALVLGGAQWLLLLFAVTFTSSSAIPELTLFRRLCIGAGAAVLLPALDLVLLQIPNGATLLFPAWFQTGKDAPQGIDMTGQRIILMIGSLLACVISLIPAGVVFAIVFFLLQGAAGPFVAFAPAALAAALVLAAEATGGILLMGWLFERFDFAVEGGN
jgi:Putative ABC exporter